MFCTKTRGYFYVVYLEKTYYKPIYILLDNWQAIIQYYSKYSARFMMVANDIMLD